MKSLIQLSMCILLFASVSEAQVRVTKSANRKMTLNLAGLRTGTDSASKLFIQTLEKDLRLSGWFEPKRGSGELQLSGSSTGNSRKLKVNARVTRTSDRATLYSKSYSVDAAQARALAHRIADDLVFALTGKKGIASSKIALVGSKGRTKELFLCDANGDNLRQITRDGKIVVGPNWGPQGENIVLTSYLRGFPDIHQINLNKQTRKTLASYSGLNTGADISPNGKEMALILSKDGNPELYIKSLRDGTLRRLTKTPRATEASPSWSPDGQQLVFVSDSSGSPQLYVVPKTGGRPRRLTSRGSENVAPDWGANGLIACASRSGGRYHIAIIQPSTGQTTYLQTDYADYESPSWAPNGRHLVASRTVNYQSGLYLLDTANDPPVALVNRGGDWLSPAWSPK